MDRFFILIFYSLFVYFIGVVFAHGTVRTMLKFLYHLRTLLSNLSTIIILGVIIFLLTHHFLPIELAQTISDDFNKVSIGIAALVTAYFGGTYFFEERLRQKRIDLYRKRYPHDNYGKTWKIIIRSDRDGEPHVFDINTSVKHHIWNMKTIFDLGWQFYKYEPVEIDDFDSYSVGDQIRTRGELRE